MTIYAIVKTLEAGYDSDKDKVSKAGFKVGDKIEVCDIIMHQSSTDIYLEGHFGSFNSVFFDFEENGEELNIYGDRRFNDYLTMYDDCD